MWRLSKTEKTFNVKRDVNRFEGWETLNKLLEEAIDLSTYPLTTPDDYPEGLISTMFLTGLRVSEVIPNESDEGFMYGLRPRYFDFSGKYYIRVREVPILKKWYYICDECGKTWQNDPRTNNGEEHDITTTRKDPESAFRTFDISKELNVLTDVFVGKSEEERVDMREKYERRNSEYYNNFINTMKEFVKECDREFLFEDLSRFQAWKICREKIGSIVTLKTPPHWFRAQRACQLAVEQDADILDLLDWFQWDDESTAHHYASIERPPDMKSGRVIG